MRPKIGVFGSSAGPELESMTTKAKAVGTALAFFDPILITGACAGLPYAAALAAREHGCTELWGFSPATDYKGQVAITPECDNTIYSSLIYIPEHYEFRNDIKVARKYRNVTSTATCDAGIIISGRWGSMNEFTNLFDMGKIIGVLTDTGGIADELATLEKKIRKPGNAIIIFDSSPEALVRRIIETLKKRMRDK